MMESVTSIWLKRFFSLFLKPEVAEAEDEAIF